MYSRYIKRDLDILFAVAISLLALPMAIVIAILIKLDDGGPVMFAQKRFGRDRHPFTIYKFRTMSISAPNDSPTHSLLNAKSHITRSGNIIRKLSLDELPQLINVLKGEMSFVGPRPVVLRETNLIEERDKYHANHCMPGITGWAQANGRDELTIYEKARMDGEYANHISLGMDLRCLIRTVEALILAKGYREGARAISVPRVAAQGQVFYSKVQSNTRNIQRPIRRGRADHSNPDRV